MTLRVGDWVRSYTAGIWQVDRILDYKCIDPRTRQEAQKRTIFSRRFVSNSFKRSFSEEACDPLFVKPLGTEELKNLQVFIAENEGLHQKFCAYQAKSIDCIYSARIGIPRDRDLAAVNLKLAGAGPMSDTRILPFLAEWGFDTKAMPYWIVQFVSRNHECRDEYLVFEFLRVLGS